MLVFRRNYLIMSQFQSCLNRFLCKQLFFCILTCPHPSIHPFSSTCQPTVMLMLHQTACLKLLCLGQELIPYRASPRESEAQDHIPAPLHPAPWSAHLYCCQASSLSCCAAAILRHCPAACLRHQILPEATPVLVSRTLVPSLQPGQLKLLFLHQHPS